MACLSIGSPKWTRLAVRAVLSSSCAKAYDTQNEAMGLLRLDGFFSGTCAISTVDRFSELGNL